ncbi:nitroreductase [Mycobacterium nebraskense]|uniref:Nitroreductase n=1 Tax=Mycobacterium nebraskense TaxID=244292 RepID=A0A0F5NH78_9MYCO|nr:nitroreductase [Mycobacterium nebraskense]KKC05588.1 nitroreductase [Mycobacterium nebraskense]KLO46425.1 nitroreductase [Mycobacterium nebraskense]MBI2693115.1 nitroreductase [Mycobacterium nebraskense]MCV7120937.1 nitroreductase [Mycobacterium nebraskense]ORW15662.1 nitroreductase [Mycobacterium nebraskense]
MSALLPETWPKPLLSAIRVSNRHLLNPLMLRLAGRKHWYASVIHHAGRRSGKQYATPVVADRTDGGFVIPLPYGTGVDWLQNVLAAGHATISSQGDSYDVAQPEVIDAAAAMPMLSADRRRTFSRLGIDHYLRVVDASSPN